MMSFMDSTLISPCFVSRAGASRQFGFVGFHDSATAEQVKKFVNNTFFDTRKITVEYAVAPGDRTLPRAWSKYTAGSSAHDKVVKETKVQETSGAQEKKAQKEHPTGGELRSSYVFSCF